jgi:hypothetical protein
MRTAMQALQCPLFYGPAEQSPIWSRAWTPARRICLFESAYAAELGLDLIAGLPMRFRTANGSFEAYGHEVEIEVLGIVGHSLVYFFADPAIRKNVLGRRGWLDLVRVGLIDHDRVVYLASFNDRTE